MLRWFGSLFGLAVKNFETNQNSSKTNLALNHLLRKPWSSGYG